MVESPQVRTSGRFASTQLSANVVSCLQIEETFVLPLLAGYGRHVGQGSNLGRKSRLESRRVDNRNASNSHRNHACA